MQTDPTLTLIPPTAQKIPIQNELSPHLPINIHPLPTSATTTTPTPRHEAQLERIDNRYFSTRLSSEESADDFEVGRGGGGRVLECCSGVVFGD